MNIFKAEDITITALIDHIDEPIEQLQKYLKVEVIPAERTYCVLNGTADEEMFGRNHSFTLK